MDGLQGNNSPSGLYARRHDDDFYNFYGEEANIISLNNGEMINPTQVS